MSGRVAGTKSILRNCPPRYAWEAKVIALVCGRPGDPLQPVWMGRACYLLPRETEAATQQRGLSSPGDLHRR